MNEIGSIFWNVDIYIFHTFSFICIEISLSDQTPGAETLSKVCVLTIESSASSVLDDPLLCLMMLNDA